ncbi:MAG TPA: hypothetical protein VM938_09005 [Acidimicrobiales bacterium]|nr:hypothetical protein [Acidimicrobiales bacterium]
MSVEAWFQSQGGAVAAARRAVSSDGRLLNAAVLAGMAGLVAGGTAYVLCGEPDGRGLGLLVLGVAIVALLASTRYAVGLVRIFLVASLVVVAVGLIDVGRGAIGRERAASARETAGELRTKLLAASKAADPARATGGGAAPAPDALAELGRLLAVAPPGPAIDSLRSLEADLRALLAGPSASARLAEQRRRVKALDLGALRGAAEAAVAAVEAAVLPKPAPAPASPKEAEEAVDQLCKAAGGAMHLDGAAPRCLADSTCSVLLAELELLGAGAEVEVARYEHALATDKAKEAAEKDLEEKLDKRAAAAGRRGRGVEDVDAVAAVRAGGGVLLGELPWIGGDGEEADQVPVDPGVVGWLLLAALSVLTYVALERRAARKALGPVVVQPIKENEPGPEDELFRTYVLRNVPAPGAVPGAAALVPVAELLDATKVPAGNAIGKLVAAVAVALGEKRGYTVTYRTVPTGTPATAPAATPTPAAAETPPTVPGATPTTIAVRVTDRRTKEVVHQRLVHDNAPAEALRKAAYWAATVVLARSDRVPHWAQWPADSSDALAAYHADDDKGEKPPVKLMEQAVAKAPGNGLLCLWLSNAYALEGQHLDAFELALRAATVNRHYVAARYRLAMAASLLASDVDANWVERPAHQRQRVTAMLRRYLSHGEKLAAALDAPDAKKALCTFALAELRDIDQRLGLFRVCFSALCRSERSYWLAFFRAEAGGVSARRQFMRAIASSRPAIVRRGVLSKGDFPKGDFPKGDQRSLLKDPWTFWQVAYNLACDDAIRADVEGMKAAEDALKHLEMALERPGSHQLTRAWVEKDPDLEPLHRLLRFTAFVEALPREQETDAD